MTSEAPDPHEVLGPHLAAALVHAIETPPKRAPEGWRPTMLGIAAWGISSGVFGLIYPNRRPATPWYPLFVSWSLIIGGLSTLAAFLLRARWPDRYIPGAWFGCALICAAIAAGIPVSFYNAHVLGVGYGRAVANTPTLVGLIAGFIALWVQLVLPGQPGRGDGVR